MNAKQALSQLSHTPDPTLPTLDLATYKAIMCTGQASILKDRSHVWEKQGDLVNIQSYVPSLL